MTDDKTSPAPEPPNVVGLTGTEAVFRILAYTGRPMKKRDIDEWLKDAEQPSLRQGQIAGAFWRLTTAYENVVEKRERGLYQIHPAWDGKPLDQQRQEDDTDYGTTAPAEADESQPDNLRPLIPCYGLYWHRDQVAWEARGGKPQLLGFPTDGEGDAVDFAYQRGVYILYNWPNIIYVGRTTKSLYERLRGHDKNPRRAHEWDRFSWFGLYPVDTNDALAAPNLNLDMSDIVAAFETLLITILSPPFNDKSGDRLGQRYLQIPDSIVEEQEQKKLAGQMKELWANVRFGKS